MSVGSMTGYPFDPSQMLRTSKLLTSLKLRRARRTARVFDRISVGRLSAHQYIRYGRGQGSYPSHGPAPGGPACGFGAFRRQPSVDAPAASESP